MPPVQRFSHILSFAVFSLSTVYLVLKNVALKQRLELKPLRENILHIFVFPTRVEGIVLFLAGSCCTD